jgi:hypothetical protein
MGSPFLYVRADIHAFGRCDGKGRLFLMGIVFCGGEEKNFLIMGGFVDTGGRKKSNRFFECGIMEGLCAAWGTRKGNQKPWRVFGFRSLGLCPKLPQGRPGVCAQRKLRKTKTAERFWFAQGIGAE